MYKMLLTLRGRGGGVLRLIFAGYQVSLASQSRYPRYSLFCGRL